MLDDLKKEIQRQLDPHKATFLQRFFKTGEGEYGEGDLFLGLTVSQSRKIAKEYKDLSLSDSRTLLLSNYHEERLIALFILVHQFQKGDSQQKKDIYDFYLSHKDRINNWDLVDSSADKIVGEYLLDKPTGILASLASSKSVWDRRIAVLATFQFIKNKRYDETLMLAEMLLSDSHDLIHKAVGWMLREIGERSIRTEEEFLIRHYKKMPRTMLRYAIEKFPEKKRKAYLEGNI